MSLLLLLVAIGLLYLAATNKLSQLIDGVDVALGKSTATPNASATTASVTPSNINLSLPSLPPIGTSAQVDV